MSYHIFETQAKNFLIEKYPRYTWNKLSSQHHIDLLGIGMRESADATPIKEPTIVLVEVKFTKKPKYYCFENKRKTAQLEYYLHEAEVYKAKGFSCLCFLVVKVNKKIHMLRFNSLEDIPRFIQ